MAMKNPPVQVFRKRWLVVAIWHMFSTGSLHEDLGPDHFERRDKERRVRYLVAQIEKMGVEVQVRDQAA